MLFQAHLQAEDAAGVKASRVIGARGELLRCVWSCHPRHDRDCRACIPARVVDEAWQREREEYSTPEGFFYFSWNGGVWLGYGYRDGRVRGVYCPTHCAERTANLLRPAPCSGPAGARLPFVALAATG